jgi:hypothetical protein
VNQISAHSAQKKPLLRERHAGCDIAVPLQPCSGTLSPGISKTRGRPSRAWTGWRWPLFGRREASIPCSTLPAVSRFLRHR